MNSLRGVSWLEDGGKSRGKEGARTQATRTRYDGADDNARELIRRTKRVTRRRFTPEEKVRIVIEGIRGEIPISALCRREGIRTNVYYKWLKDYWLQSTPRMNRPP